MRYSGILALFLPCLSFECVRLLVSWIGYLQSGPLCNSRGLQALNVSVNNLRCPR